MGRPGWRPRELTTRWLYIGLASRKGIRLEIHTLTPTGLQPFLDVGIYGRISALRLFRPKVRSLAREREHDRHEQGLLVHTRSHTHSIYCGWLAFVVL